MGVTKQIIKQGHGADFPKNGDKDTMEYTGWIDENGSKGKQ
jgi:FK506-binding protein 1